MFQRIVSYDSKECGIGTSHGQGSTAISSRSVNLAAPQTQRSIQSCCTPVNIAYPLRCTIRILWTFRLRAAIISSAHGSINQCPMLVCWLRNFLLHFEQLLLDTTSGETRFILNDWIMATLSLHLRSFWIIILLSHAIQSAADQKRPNIIFMFGDDLVCPSFLCLSTPFYSFAEHIHVPPMDLIP